MSSSPSVSEETSTASSSSATSTSPTPSTPSSSSASSTDVVDCVSPSTTPDPELAAELQAELADEKKEKKKVKHPDKMPIDMKKAAVDPGTGKFGDEKLYTVAFESEYEFGVKGVTRGPEGASKFVDKEELAKQKGVFGDLVKSMGKAILAGKSVINISLPVRIFEPRSFLQRITDIWGFIPLMLRRAALSKDPVERMKWTVTMAVAGLHRGVKQLKPFNPTLGETWQARYADGTELYFEQTFHHPPITSFQVIGPDNMYRVSGYNEYFAIFRPNGVTGAQIGPIHIDFLDGTRITYQCPQALISGALFGDRLFNWVDRGKPITFVDEKNNLRAELRFNPDELNMLWSVFSSAKTPSDYVRGHIQYHVNQPDPKTKKVSKDPVILSKCEGSWLDFLSWDGEYYWYQKRYEPLKPLPVEESEALPSDSRFRPDLISLKEALDKGGDKESYAAAQKVKEQVELKERADRKLRKANTPKQYITKWSHVA